mmetsp:Transcript_38144/g.79317  ORF Transcript_38144/g.79317 Transcript_38144/m.79317 type:complete len:80 (+) Transcript_38144:116-355(+)
MGFCFSLILINRETKSRFFRRDIQDMSRSELLKWSSSTSMDDLYSRFNQLWNRTTCNARNDDCQKWRLFKCHPSFKIAL